MTIEEISIIFDGAEAGTNVSRMREAAVKQVKAIDLEGNASRIKHVEDSELKRGGRPPKGILDLGLSGRKGYNDIVVHGSINCNAQPTSYMILLSLYNISQVDQVYERPLFCTLKK